MTEIEQLAGQRQRVDGALRDARIQVDDLSLEQRRADAEVEQVKTRRQRDRDRLDAGQVTNPKDVERMQHELGSLERRIGVLEDAELEVMERAEEAQSAAATLEGESAAIAERLETLLAARDDQLGAIDADLAEVTDQRAPAAAGLPDALVALYERLREQKGGVGAAALRARACGGCRLTLDNAELTRIRGLPEDEVVRCEECSRILVRTPESGL